MCGTSNDQSAQTCSFCGYLFEDYSTGTVPPPKTDGGEVSGSSLNSVAPPIDQNSGNSYAPVAMTGGTALFEVSKSFLSAIVPALFYLVFIAFVGLSTGFSLYTILLIGFFLVVALVPSLFAPRRFEFYDDSLKIYKTVGGSSEYQYSQMSLMDYPRRRGNQIVLSVQGRRQPILINKNPTNPNLGIDLKQFLTKKLKKPPSPGTPQDTSSPDQPDTSSATDQSNPTI